MAVWVVQPSSPVTGEEHGMARSSSRARGPWAELELVLVPVLASVWASASAPELVFALKLELELELPALPVSQVFRHRH